MAIRMSLLSIANEAKLIFSNVLMVSNKNIYQEHVEYDYCKLLQVTWVRGDSCGHEREGGEQQEQALNPAYVHPVEGGCGGGTREDSLVT